jgi:hypothetical protein
MNREACRGFVKISLESKIGSVEYVLDVSKVLAAPGRPSSQ